MNPWRVQRPAGRWLAFSAVIHLFIFSGLFRFAGSDTVAPIRDRSLFVSMATLPADPPARKAAGGERPPRPAPAKKSDAPTIRDEPEVPLMASVPAPAPPPEPEVPFPGVAAVAAEPVPFIGFPRDALMNTEPKAGEAATGGNGSVSETPPAIPQGYLSEVRNRIERAKRYPWSARVRGLEGTSLVRFRIAANGSVRDVAISRSSAHKILDDAAVRTVERAAPFPAIPVEAASENIEINIPMVYELH